MKKTIGILFITSLLIAANNGSVVSKNDFLRAPLGYPATVENLKASTTPEFKVQQYYLTRQSKSKRDTIYKFHCKGIELFINRRHGQDWLFTGVITSDKLILQNEVKVGMSKNDFIASFSDIENLPTDTLKLESDLRRNFTFIFKKEKLKEIRIDNLRKD